MAVLKQESAAVLVKQPSRSMVLTALMAGECDTAVVWLEDIQKAHAEGEAEAEGGMLFVVWRVLLLLLLWWAGGGGYHPRRDIRFYK